MNTKHLSRWRVRLACWLLEVNEDALQWAFHILTTAPQYKYAVEEDKRD